MLAGGANTASGGIGKGANARTGAGAAGAAAQVPSTLLILGAPLCCWILPITCTVYTE